MAWGRQPAVLGRLRESEEERSDPEGKEKRKKGRSGRAGKLKLRSCLRWLIVSGFSWEHKKLTGTRRLPLSLSFPPSQLVSIRKQLINIITTSPTNPPSTPSFHLHFSQDKQRESFRARWRVWCRWRKGSGGARLRRRREGGCWGEERIDGR